MRVCRSAHGHTDRLSSAEVFDGMVSADVKEGRGKRPLSEDAAPATAAQVESASDWHSDLDRTSSDSGALAAATGRARRVRLNSGRALPLRVQQRTATGAGVT